MNFREEFRWKNFGFSQCIPLQRFFVFQWRIPGIVYIIYRIIAALYCITWLIYTASRDSGAPQAWGAYLTSWTYTLETIYFTLHAVFAIFFYFWSWERNSVSLRARMSLEEQRSLFPEIINEEQSIYAQVPQAPQDAEQNILDPEYNVERPHDPPWYVIIVWILFNSVSANAVMVSIVFWAILVPTNVGDLGKMSLGNLQLHLINSVLLLIEHSLTAFPVRILHAIYPVTYGIIYLLFSVLYWTDDHSHVMYNILDWNKPGPTIGYVFLVGFVIIPINHLIMFAIYRIKLKILTSCCL